MSLTVLCVRWGSKYGNEYVRRLQAGVARHLSLEHRFVCLTNDPVPGVCCLPLPSGLPNWWAKIGMFRPGIIDGEKLYLDLDDVVHGPLDPFVRRDAPTKVWALDDFSYSLRTPKTDLDPTTRGLLGGPGTCNSSVLYWTADFGSDLWDKFRFDTMNRLHGDQNQITQTLWPHTLELYPPGLACSYKYDVLYGKGRFGSVTVFHGDPKPHQLDVGDPLREAWCA